MDTNEKAAASRRIRRVLVALIFFAAALNYVDRQVLALLKPILQTEFSWDNQDFAHLGSVFQLSAAVALPFVGWFVDRIGVRWGYLIAVGVWSLAGMAHAFATSMQQFVAARAVLAVAESVHTPAAVKSMATYLPLKERSLGIGLMNTAPNVGAVLTPLLIPPIALAFGWKSAFIVTGALGFVWMAFWWPSVRRLKPVQSESVQSAALRVPVRWSSLFRQRSTWAFVGAKLLVDQVWWFVLFWTPDFFHRVFGMGQAELGKPIAIVYSMAAIGALSSGMLFPRLLDRGYAVDRARKVPMLVYALLILPIPLAITAGLAVDGGTDHRPRALCPPGVHDQPVRPGCGRRAAVGRRDGHRARRGGGQPFRNGDHRTRRLVARKRPRLLADVRDLRERLPAGARMDPADAATAAARRRAGRRRDLRTADRGGRLHFGALSSPTPSVVSSRRAPASIWSIITPKPSSAPK